MLTEEEMEQIRYAAGHLIGAEENPDDPHAGDSADLAWEIFDEMLSQRRDIRRDFGGPMTANSAGEWVPAIPLPLFISLGRNRCHYVSATGGKPCDKKSWTMDEYRQHFAYQHILMGE